MLRVEAIETYYGASQVLFGLSLEVRHSEVVALLGRNGMGKTTTVRSIMGLTPIQRRGHYPGRAPSPYATALPHCPAGAWPGAGRPADFS